MVVQWLALSPHSKRVLGLNPLADWGPSVCSLGFLFHQSKDMQVRLIGDSKLATGVTVSDCLSLYVGRVTDWRAVQGVPRRSPQCQLGSAPAPPRPC